MTVEDKCSGDEVESLDDSIPPLPPPMPKFDKRIKMTEDCEMEVSFIQLYELIPCLHYYNY